MNNNVLLLLAFVGSIRFDTVRFDSICRLVEIDSRSFVVGLASPLGCIKLLFSKNGKKQDFFLFS